VVGTGEINAYRILGEYSWKMFACKTEEMEYG
jgi:hypothetical protein